MSLLRFAGRSMLASFFVVNGFKSATKPDDLVAAAEPIAQKIVPLAQRVAPPSVANYIPTETKTLVRLSGVAQVLGGLGYALGIARRPSSAMLAACMVPHVLTAKPDKSASAEERAAGKSIMLRNVALLGAVLVASQDTEGKPSLGWRAKDQQKHISKAASQQKKELEKSAGDLSKKSKKKCKKAAKSVESALS